ncbi:MAG TPA: radical SAM protein [Candidatus Aenigmarchaeota archaeon]|nr:radical SAM protein [Candidatus Aenigmarchaeota archaeon]
MKQDPYDNIAVNTDGSPCLFTEVDGIRVTWETTGRCDLGCAHCSVDATKNPCTVDISLDSAKHVLEEAAKAGVTSIYVSGGEPLLWKPVYDTLSYAHDLGIFTSLATNGKYVNMLTASKLKNAKTGKVLVSVDSHIPELHDDLRGARGSHEMATRAIKELSDRDMFVRVGHVIWKNSIDHVEEFADSMLTTGAHEIAYNWLIPAGRAKNNPDIAIPNERYGEIGGRLRELKTKMADRLTISYHRFDPMSEKHDCEGGRKFYQITPEGSLTPCSWIGKMLPEYTTKTSVYSTPLDELMHSDEIRRFREMIDKRHAEFGPGCPAMCIAFNGTHMSRDPIYIG